jgi:hypothetical protein
VNADCGGAEPIRFDDVEPFMGLDGDAVARLVFWLLVEEALRNKLSVFRQNLPAEPIES